MESLEVTVTDIEWIRIRISKYNTSFFFQVYSKTLCRRCFRLLDELDGIEQRSVVLKTTIEELYNRSLLRRMKGPRVNEEETIGKDGCLQCH